MLIKYLCAHVFEYNLVPCLTLYADQCISCVLCLFFTLVHLQDIFAYKMKQIKLVIEFFYINTTY